jgi:CBS domain-containing membrane protein
MPTINVSEIMTTKPRTMRADDSVAIADWLLALDAIHHVVVVDEHERVIGIVSDRDLLRAFGSQPTPNLPISRIMSRNPQTIAADVPATEAVERMLRSKFHALPVTDSTGRLLGIITASDFLDVARWVLYGLDARAPSAKIDRPVI